MSDKIIVIALGGNALLRRGQKGSFDEQYSNVKETVAKIADLIQRGYKIVLTHGNGPQLAPHLCGTRPLRASFHLSLSMPVAQKHRAS